MKYYSTVHNGNGFLVRDKQDGSPMQSYSASRDLWRDAPELGARAKDRRQGDFSEIDSEVRVREIMESMKNPIYSQRALRLMERAGLPVPAKSAA